MKVRYSAAEERVIEAGVRGFCFLADMIGDLRGWFSLFDLKKGSRLESYVL